MIFISSTKSIQGWILDGKLIHPVEAYTDLDDWFVSFESLFPERKKKMRDYSKLQGWNEYVHRNAWRIVLIPWLDKYCSKDTSS